MGGDCVTGIYPGENFCSPPRLLINQPTAQTVDDKEGTAYGTQVDVFISATLSGDEANDCASLIHTYIHTHTQTHTHTHTHTHRHALAHPRVFMCVYAHRTHMLQSLLETLKRVHQQRHFQLAEAAVAGAC